MIRLMLKWLPILFFAPLSICYARGPANGGGGFGFLCNNGEVYLADVYDLVVPTKPGARPKLDIRRGGLQPDGTFVLAASEEEALNHALNSIEFLSNREAEKIRYALQVLYGKPRQRCEVKPMKDANFHPNDIPVGCVLVQLVSQEDGVICQNDELVDALSGVEQALLKIHEAHVFYKQQNEFSNRLRQKVNRTAGSYSFIPASSFSLPLPRAPIMQPRP